MHVSIDWQHRMIYETLETCMEFLTKKDNQERFNKKLKKFSAICEDLCCISDPLLYNIN